MTDAGPATAVAYARDCATWDYAVHSIHARHDNLLEEQLKERGRDGWELVFVNMPMANEFQCIFRRPGR